MKLRLTIVMLALLTTATAGAQTPPRIAIAIDVRSEGRPDADATAARVAAEVRRQFAAIADVDVVPPDGARRTIWIIAGATPPAAAVSVMVTERYDRETLMVLGIEDDEMAFRMMALQIVTDHQIFTGGTPAAIAKRIVASIDRGVFARLRALPPRP